MGLRTAIRGVAESLVREQELGFCDGLRGFAMLWVCAMHGGQTFATTGVGSYLTDLWWPVMFPLTGDFGVDIFLTLSGFLIGGALYREVSKTSRIALGPFVVRRIFRIFPSLFSALFLTTILEMAAGLQRSCPFPKWYMYLFVWNNNLGSSPPDCIGHTWTVALELQLYLATPLVLAVAAGARSLLAPLTGCHALERYVTMMGVLAWIACAAVRLWFVMTKGLLDDQGWVTKGAYAFYYQSQYRFGPYIAGLLVGVNYAARKQQGLVKRTSESLFASLGLAASVAVIICTCVFDAYPMVKSDADIPIIEETMAKKLFRALGRPLFSVAVANIIYLCAEGLLPRTAGLLGARACRVVAGLSYSMYVMQYIVVELLADPYAKAIGARFDDNDPAWLGALAMYGGIVMCILAAAPVALLNYALVERPCIFAGRYCIGLLSARPAFGGAQEAPNLGTAAEEQNQEKELDLEAACAAGQGDHSATTTSWSSPDASVSSDTAIDDNFAPSEAPSSQ